MLAPGVLCRDLSAMLQKGKGSLFMTAPLFTDVRGEVICPQKSMVLPRQAACLACAAALALVMLVCVCLRGVSCSSF